MEIRHSKLHFFAGNFHFQGAKGRAQGPLPSQQNQYTGADPKEMLRNLFGTFAKMRFNVNGRNDATRMSQNFENVIAQRETDGQEW